MKRWVEQDLEKIPSSTMVLATIHHRMLHRLREGERVGRASLDHNAKDYIGIGNKQLMIAVSEKMGRDVTMDEAWSYFSGRYFFMGTGE